MPRILVVDDEPLIAMMIADWIADEGHETVGPAHSVPQAMSLIEAHEIDGAILDVTLGDQKSYDIADVLSARSIPFAFATGYGADGVDQRFRNVPIVSKPFDFETVSHVVARLIAARAG